VSGTPGGAGTYVLSAPNTASASALTSTLASGTMYVATNTSTTPVVTFTGTAHSGNAYEIDATSVSGGALQPGMTVSGTGITTGTTISAQMSGSYGTTGTYFLSTTNTASGGTITGTGTFGSGQVVFGKYIRGLNFTNQAFYLLNAASPQLSGGIGFAKSVDSTFSQTTVTAGQTNANLTTSGASGGSAAYPMTTAGSIVRVTACVGEPLTAGSATVAVTKNGVALARTLTITTAQRCGYALFSMLNDPVAGSNVTFAPNDLIGATITTSGTLAPANDGAQTVYVEVTSQLQW